MSVSWALYDSQYPSILAYSTSLWIQKTLLEYLHRAHKKRIFAKKVFSWRGLYIPCIWYDAIRCSEGGDTRARSISYCWCCYGIIFFYPWWYQGTTEPQEYIQGTRIRHWCHSHQDRSHRLGRAGSPPPQCCPHRPRVRACESSEEVMGELHWCSDTDTLTKERMNCIHPLGELCHRQEVSHRWVTTSYHHLTSSESVFCIYWILGF